MASILTTATSLSHSNLIQLMELIKVVRGLEKKEGSEITMPSCSICDGPADPLDTNGGVFSAEVASGGAIIGIRCGCRSEPPADYRALHKVLQFDEPTFIKLYSEMWQVLHSYMSERCDKYVRRIPNIPLSTQMATLVSLRGDKWIGQVVPFPWKGDDEIVVYGVPAEDAAGLAKALREGRADVYDLNGSISVSITEAH